LRRIGRIILICFATLGVVTALVIGFGIWAVSRVSEGDGLRPLPSSMMLTIDMDRGFRQTADNDPIAVLSGEDRPYVLSEAVAALDRAAKDDTVKGVFATLGAAKLGMAGTQELMDALDRFKASGKPAVLFADSIGESGNGTLSYYLSTAFGRIWLQPSGEVALQGFGVESPFLKGLFDWIGVQPQFSGRWEYKSAIEMFTEKGMTQPHRENIGALLDSFTDQVSGRIAKARRLDPAVAKGLLGKGPYMADEALRAGLVDQLGYFDQAKDDAASLADHAKAVDLAEYGAKHHESSGTAIAVITGEGAIHRDGSFDPFGNGRDFAADVVAGAIRDAVKDSKVKAILFRVDSPGGSYTASDTVWREVVRARAAGKPVVVSMGDVAASGGYFVGMAADRVVAEPGTITGSIGVFTGKLVMKDLWTKLGVDWDGVLKGDNAGMWSANQPFTPAQWDRVNQMLDTIYKDFTTKAAQGRHIDPARMDELARGRVWSGADAKRLGLVDDLGGIDVAEADIRQLLKLDENASLRPIAFPRPRKPWEVVGKMLEDGASDRLALGRMSAAMKMFDPLIRGMERMQAEGQGAQLRMEPVE
jgi:protease-4